MKNRCLQEAFGQQLRRQNRNNITSSQQSRLSSCHAVIRNFHVCKSEAMQQESSLEFIINDSLQQDKLYLSNSGLHRDRTKPAQGDSVEAQPCKIGRITTPCSCPISIHNEVSHDYKSIHSLPRWVHNHVMSRLMPLSVLSQPESD